MRVTNWILASWVAVVLGASVVAGASEVEAIAQARDDLQLSFTVDGRVAEVHVKPGDRVSAGDLLMTLDDEAGLARIRLLSTRASSTLSIDAASAEWELRKVEERLMRDAFERGGANAFEMERAALQTRLAELSLARARELRVEAEQELEVARQLHEQFVLRAPIDGIVDQAVVSVGEGVERLRPVLRLVVTDPLRIDAPVPTAQSLGLGRGDTVRIRSAMTGTTDVMLTGRIVHVAEVADAASDTRNVRIEAVNAAGLPAGLRVFVIFQNDAAESSVSNDTEKSSRSASAQHH